MATDQRSCFAKIRFRSEKSDQITHAGCGFLVEANYLVTCCHVLETAIGKEQIANGLSFVVDFPFIPGLTKISMELVSFFPRKINANIDDLADMALLKFSEGKNPKIDYSSPPIKYPSLDAQKGHEVEIYSTRSSDFVYGKCKKAVETGWIVIDTKTINVEPGDSGSPVWNKSLKGITGMLVARDKQNETCYLIPTVKIQQAFEKYLTSPRTENLSKSQLDDKIDLALQQDREFLKKVHESLSELLLLK